MEKLEDIKIYKYTLNLMENAGDDILHILISLRKVITKEKNYINREIFNGLMKSERLSVVQKKVLEKATDEKSDVYKVVVGLNDKYEPGSLEKIYEVVRSLEKKNNIKKQANSN